MAKRNHCDDLPELCEASSFENVKYYSRESSFDVKRMLASLDGIEDIDKNFDFGVIDRRFLDYENSTENRIFSISMTPSAGFSKSKPVLSKDPAQSLAVINKLSHFPKISVPPLENNSWTAMNSPTVVGKLMSMLTMDQSPPESDMQERNYLKTGSTMNQSTSLKTPDVVIYSCKLGNFEGKDIKYYIEAAPAKILPRVDSFTVSVRRPDGTSSRLTIHRDDKKSRYYCSFRAVMGTAGPHILSLTWNQNGSPHVRGSPVVVQVTRDYARNNSPFVMLGLGQKSTLVVKPWGVDVYLPENHIYLTDRGNNQIVMLDGMGRTLKTFGETGQEDGQFYRPTGIAVDAVNKRLIISDKDNHRICLYTLRGDFISCFGSSGHKNGQFNYPWGVAVSPDGEIIAVADSRNFRLQLFDKNCKYIQKYSVFEVNPFEYKNQFQCPRGIIFDKEGQNMFVSDFNIHAIFKINVECTQKTTILPAGHVDRPQGMSIDSAGNLVVCDSKNNCIRVICSSSGRLLNTVKQTGNIPFTGPLDVTVLKDGKLAVVDTSGTSGTGAFRIF